MAPPNGTQLFALGPRRRMIQPVLPALPPNLQNKNKNENKNKRLEPNVEGGQTNSKDFATVETRSSAAPTNKLATDYTDNEVGEHDIDAKVEEVNIAEELVSSSKIVAQNNEVLHESLKTIQPLLNEETEQAEDANLHKDTAPTIPGVESVEEFIEADTTNPHQIDASTIYTNGYEEGKSNALTSSLESLEPTALVTDIASPVYYQNGDRTHVELPAHTVISSITQSTVSPMVESSVKQDRSTDALNRTIPEATTNGHISPIRPSGQQHHNLNVLSPGRTTQIPTIHDHLLHLANSKQWADWVIEVNQPDSHLQPFIGYAHSFVLLRSEKMRKIITQPQNPTFANNAIGLYPARSIQPHAFEAALRFLYSDTVLSAEALFPRDTYMDKHARAHVVDYTLSYWAAGIELGLDPVSTRAFNLLAGMIDWDIAELLIKEFMAIRASAPLVSEVETPSEFRIMAESILRQVLHLFTHQLDLAQFRLDTEAQTDLLASRLAQFDYGRPASNPALASMVFGSMPSSGNHSPSAPHDTRSSSSADAVASVILLNLDFADLCVFAREVIGFHGDAGLRIICEVVDERERRRLLIVSNRGIPNKQRIASSALWENLGLREYVDEGRLRREHVGYLLPHKRR